MKNPAGFHILSSGSGAQSSMPHSSKLSQHKQNSSNKRDTAKRKKQPLRNNQNNGKKAGNLSALSQRSTQKRETELQNYQQRMSNQAVVMTSDQKKLFKVDSTVQKRNT